MSDRWVVNASPLILLAKVNQLSLLDQLSVFFVVPEAVVTEILAVFTSMKLFCAVSYGKQSVKRGLRGPSRLGWLYCLPFSSTNLPGLGRHDRPCLHRQSLDIRPTRAQPTPLHEITRQTQWRATRAIRLHLQEMLAYHGPRGLILFRKHLKRYLKDLPPTDDICSEMVVAKNTAEFEKLLVQLEEKFGTNSVHILDKIKPHRLNKVSLFPYHQHYPSLDQV